MGNEYLLDKLAIDEIKTQSDFLAEKIKDMIVSHEMDEGFVFPNENDFCKRLNVSRGTLREAYKILDTQGFIQRTKHGTYVKCRDDIAKQGNFVASLELADEKEMVEFICTLEPEAVFLAAQKSTAADMEKLRPLMDACEEAGDDWRLMLPRNYEFHSFIRGMSDNNLIMSALSAYYDIFNQQIIGSIYATTKNTDAFRKKSFAEHRELFDAIEKNDAERAKAIEYNHLREDIEFREKHRK